MRKPSLSIKIYIGLIITLAILTAINVFLPQGVFLPTQELPAPKSALALINAAIMLILYGGLGFLGLKLSQKLGYANLWDSKISNKQRFLIPALIGVSIGVFFILVDVILNQFHSLGSLPHPPFPTSLVASVVAGIGEELIFRLFFISFWVWLISYVLLKKRWQNQIFWIIAIFSALAFAFGHIPSVMILFGLNTISEIPLALMGEIILLNGVVSLFAAYYFRKFGFLAAVGIHFWTDVVWHIVWGVI
ncbi:MAG TPA: CPBP family glutamic-type intramembrane protease [Candidatus Marinimicrobia bacterium]|nr:CPBP family glutamic-type intramembrane protease [Candidatus Neomarinimicrobiota bacterium]HQE94488.1 CPBP family glutamic-type intramembrane protease [Candidatus Neomarinimicrobiota bacterium]HQH55163.1 CPBP family glutamic-type intramembrane protease [Candidatus Neomarinimicrobiota bacterium]HRU01279.1 CPBP family glutamic-type intramembrane protease [Victivallales bacterium]